MNLEPSQIWGALILFFVIPAVLTLPLSRGRSRKWQFYALLVGLVLGWIGLVLVFIADKAPHNLFDRTPQSEFDHPNRNSHS